MDSSCAKKYQDYLTLEELAIVNKLVDQLCKDNVDYDEDLYDNNTLIRFLRAKDMNQKEAYKLFVNFINWREKESNNIENLKFTEIDQIKDLHPHGLHKTDIYGRPVYVEVWGGVDFSKIMKVTSHERLQYYYIQRHEFLINNAFPSCSSEANKFVGQMNLIIDIRNFSLLQISRELYKMIEKRSDNYELYYPELLGRCNILSNSIAFKAIWTIISGFLSSNTKKRVFFIGSDYRTELSKIIDPKNLPKIFGGDCECPGGCLKSELGPWTQKI